MIVMNLYELKSLRKAHCSLPCRFYFTYQNQEIADFILNPFAGIELISGELIPRRDINSKLINISFDQWYDSKNLKLDT